MGSTRWLDLWAMQLGSLAALGVQLEGTFLLATANIDRYRALRSTGAAYFKHPSYKVLSPTWL